MAGETAEANMQRNSLVRRFARRIGTVMVTLNPRRSSADATVLPSLVARTVSAAGNGTPDCEAFQQRLAYLGAHPEECQSIAGSFIEGWSAEGLGERRLPEAPET